MSSHYIDLPEPSIYTPFYEPLDWAKKYCNSYITNDAWLGGQSSGTYYYRFYFGDEKDAMLFALRWL